MNKPDLSPRTLRRIQRVYYNPAQEAVHIGSFLHMAGEAHAALAVLKDLTPEHRSHLIQNFRDGHPERRLTDDQVIAWYWHEASLLVN